MSGVPVSFTLDSQVAATESDDPAGEEWSGNAYEAVFYLDVTAGAGTTPTLDVDIEGKDPASGTWAVIASFAQHTTGTTFERITLSPVVDNPIRVKAAIGGTGVTYTYTVGVTVRN